MKISNITFLLSLYIRCSRHGVLSWSKEYATSQSSMPRLMATCILMGQQHVTSFSSVALWWTVNIKTMSIAVFLFPVQDKPTSKLGRVTYTDWGFLVSHRENARGTSIRIVYYSTPRPFTPTSITISVDQSPSERYSHSGAQDMARLVSNLKMLCSVPRILFQSGPF